MMKSLENRKGNCSEIRQTGMLCNRPLWRWQRATGSFIFNVKLLMMPRHLEFHGCGFHVFTFLLFS